MKNAKYIMVLGLSMALYSNIRPMEYNAVYKSQVKRNAENFNSKDIDIIIKKARTDSSEFYLFNMPDELIEMIVGKLAETRIANFTDILNFDQLKKNLMQDKDLNNLLFSCKKLRYIGIAYFNLLIRKRFEQLIDENIQNNNSPLILAVEKGNINMIKTFIAKGIDLELLDKDGNSALYVALKVCNINAIKLLIAQGANISFDTKEHKISYAVNMINKWLTNLFQKSIDIGDYKNINEIITNNKNNINFTLINAAKEEYVNIVKLLLESGASTNVKDSSGYTALVHAAKNGHTDIVRLLIENNINNINNISDNERTNALYFAVYNGYTDIAELLLDTGVIYNNINSLLFMSIDRYCYNRLNLKRQINKDMIGLLIKNKADINAKHNGLSYLMMAVDKRNLSLVKKILKNKDVININDIDDNGNTALIRAIKNNSVNIMRFLIESGANPYTEDDNGNTALILVIDKGRDMLEAFLKCKYLGYSYIDINYVNNRDADTPLIRAVKSNITCLVEMLIEAGVGFYTKDKEGNSPLILAVKNNNLKIVELLLKEIQVSNDINDIDGDGCTALIYAIINGNRDIVGLILSLGANPYAEDKYGNSALELALNKQNEDIIELLLARISK